MRRRVSSAASARRRCSYCRWLGHGAILAIRLDSSVHSIRHTVRQNTPCPMEDHPCETSVDCTGSTRADRRARARPAWPPPITPGPPCGIDTLRRGAQAETCPALPRATAISTRSMELLRSWGLEDAVRAGGIDVEWQMLACETLAAAAAGAARCRSALPTPGAERRDQPDVARPACPRTTSSRSCSATCGRSAAARVAAGHRGRRARGRRPDGVRRRAARRRAAASRPDACTPRYLDRRPTARTARCARALGIPMRGPDRPRRRRSPRCSARRSGTCSATHRYGIYAITHPRPPASSSRRAGRPLAVRHDLGARPTSGSRTTPRSA